jgi:hypothetical protein
MRHDLDESLFDNPVHEHGHELDPAQQAFEFGTLHFALDATPRDPGRRERRFPLRSLTGTVRAPGLPPHRLQVHYCPVSRYVLSHRLTRAD